MILAIVAWFSSPSPNAPPMTRLTASATQWLDHPPTWLKVALIVVVATLVASTLANAVPHTKDPRRMFTPSERAEIFRRAGMRCEHRPLLGFRCSQAAAHADHIHPHARGGATSLANGQALCQGHNLRKSSKVPDALTVWLLARRRRRYFPEGVPVAVSRRLTR